MSFVLLTSVFWWASDSVAVSVASVSYTCDSSSSSIVNSSPGCSGLKSVFSTLLSCSGSVVLLLVSSSRDSGIFLVGCLAC